MGRAVHMALQSQLFQGDAKLEAAAVSDPAHIMQGAKGEHVAKIQQALIQLDGASITPDGDFGPATAAAVLAYKQKRSIINLSYQTQADDIVGKMTVVALDLELLSREIPSGPVRIYPVLPVKSRMTSVVPRLATGANLLAFQRQHSLWQTRSASQGEIGTLSAFSSGIGDLRISQTLMELKLGEQGQFRVENGKGRSLGVLNDKIALVTGANSSSAGMIKIESQAQDFFVHPQTEGRTVVFVDQLTSSSLMEIIVIAEVSVTFHFINGTSGVKTTRPLTEVDGLIQAMNKIYGDNHTGIMFVKRAVNPWVNAPPLRKSDGVRISDKMHTEDSLRIRRLFDPKSLFNVFFVGQFLNPLKDDKPDTNLHAATTIPPGGQPPLRCCICQDRLSSFPSSGETLAHEAGHALGVEHNETDSNALMFGGGSDKRTGTNVSREEAVRMLDSFRHWKNKPPSPFPF
jgi:peptidoglycan hydrolase-like protein with peptidoglycan-binding domain